LLDTVPALDQKDTDHTHDGTKDLRNHIVKSIQDVLSWSFLKFNHQTANCDSWVKMSTTDVSSEADLSEDHDSNSNWMEDAILCNVDRKDQEASSYELLEASVQLNAVSSWYFHTFLE
jgi:hypothetical protein